MLMLWTGGAHNLRSKAGVHRPVWRAPQGKGQSQEVGEKGEFTVSLYFVPLPRLTKVRGAFYHVKKYQEYINASELKLSTSVGSWKKQESSRKTCTSASLTMPKPLTVWTTTNSGKFCKRWEYQTTWPASWEICMQVRKQQLELDMEQ